MLALRGKTTRYATTGGWVADRTYSAAYTTGTWNVPRKLFMPRNSRPGVRVPLIVWYTGAPDVKGTSAVPSICNNTSHVAAHFAADIVIANATTFGWAVLCVHMPGGAEYPAGPIGRRAFWELLKADAAEYSLDLNRAILMGHSAGGAFAYQNNYQLPGFFAGVVILDQYVTYNNMGADTTGQEANNPPSSELMDPSFSTKALAQAEYARLAGGTPHIIVGSQEMYDLGIGDEIEDTMTAIESAGHTVTRYTTSTAHPSFATTEKHVQIKYTGRDHQTVASNWYALSHTGFYDWIAARRRGEA